jgi:vancomycin aglycone glucosyltransferase
MRALLSRYGLRGDVAPMVGLGVRRGALGAQVRVCAPPDSQELLAGGGVPLVPIDQPVRAPVTEATTAAADLSPRAAELVAARFEIVVVAAEECDARVATGVMPTGGWR